MQPGEQRQQLKVRYYDYHDARDASHWLATHCKRWGILMPDIVEARHTDDGRILLRRGDGRFETISSDSTPAILRLVLEHLSRVPRVPASDQTTENPND
ncbi:hypothetical protein PLANPX_4187 [Lacipirellula parvula]|uniref:Uncharacterized protein n=1 Tax=Lacipirellula parvula TaxID=2650471 RepID=A0A5K7XDV0_9BACT|nr:hypothetical protein PLANPX_4187 [Lacipirellula parvula]